MPTCQPTSATRSRSAGSISDCPVSANVGCAVPLNASQTACFSRTRSTRPTFGHEDATPKGCESSSGYA